MVAVAAAELVRGWCLRRGGGPCGNGRGGGGGVSGDGGISARLVLVQA